MPLKIGKKHVLIHQIGCEISLISCSFIGSMQELVGILLPTALTSTDNISSTYYNHRYFHNTMS